MDRVWWNKYIAQVRAEFPGLCFSAAKDCHGVHVTRAHHFKNSGAGAIALASLFGAEKIVLLGYDCQHTGGKKHWHGDHPSDLGNAGKVNEWPAQFALLAQKLQRISVVNCSRETSLTCWPRDTIENTLQV